MTDFIFKYLKYSNFNIKKAIKYKKASEIINPDLFDSEFYAKRYNIQDENLLLNYLFEGYKKGYSPSIDFNGEKYLEDYPNVKKSGMNPLVHYVLYGKEEGKKIFPLPEKEKNRILNQNLEYLHDYNFEEPFVSIIILNRNGESLLKMLFKDFKATANYSNFEVIVVDNDSNDGSVNYLKSLDVDFPLKIVENQDNQSFSRANNEAVKIANGEYVLLLNNDIEPTYGWLKEMMGTFLEHDNVGSVGAKLVFPFYSYGNKKSFKIQHASDIFSNRKKEVFYAYNQHSLSDPFDPKVNHAKKCISVTGACVLIKKSVYEEVGGLDEGYFYGYEDVDFSLKLYQAGYDVYYCSSALLFHHESTSRKEKPHLQENKDRLTNKWYNLLSKEMFLDKLNHAKFFTEKTLRFVIVYDEETVNQESYKKIEELVNFIKENDYEVTLINNMKKHNIDGLTDIFISFSQNYDINKLDARENVIKLLFLDNPNFSDENYDLTLNYTDTESKALLKILKDFILSKYC